MKTLPVKCIECGNEFQKSISYIKQGIKRGYTNHLCSNKCSISFNKKRQQEIKNRRIDEYHKNPKLCPNCNSIINYEDKNDKIYCSSKCAAIYTQKDGGHHHWSDEDKKRISEWAKKYAYRHSKNRIKKQCLNCKNEFEVTKCKNNKLCCSRKCSSVWIKKSGYFKNKGRGGFRPNSGTSKKGWYKGYFCGSSWELAWVIYNLDHNIPFIRNNVGFDYIFDGKQRKYYPDFILTNDNQYIEIKNYLTNQVIEKTKQFPYKLKLLYKSDLVDVFNYVEQKYGKDYIRLYEKKLDPF